MGNESCFVNADFESVWQNYKLHSESTNITRILNTCFNIIATNLDYCLLFKSSFEGGGGG